jgi:tRNA threonylcarbamoyladenosine biosynthesis protein TsaE
MSGEALVFVTESPQQTERLGVALAHCLPNGGVLALCGDLASGKTCLVRGMAEHFGGSDSVHSPTFTLINEYGVNPKLYHMDLYRLGGPDEVADLGCDEIFDSGHTVAVEWAERAGEMLPKKRVTIALSHAGGDQRRIAITDADALAEGWRDALSAVCVPV